MIADQAKFPLTGPAMSFEDFYVAFLDKFYQKVEKLAAEELNLENI